MTSKQAYESYGCKCNGFADVKEYLDGKTEDGKTNYKNLDMSAHIHGKQQEQQPQATAGRTTVISKQFKIINAKLDRLIESIEAEMKKGNLQQRKSHGNRS